MPGLRERILHATSDKELKVIVEEVNSAIYNWHSAHPKTMRRWLVAIRRKELELNGKAKSRAS